MTIQQERVAGVLDKIKTMVLADTDDADMFADVLETALNELHGQDAFGSEGQCDPRGDFRNGEFSMWSTEESP